MTFKKFALITALLITSITAAAAGPTASHYQDRAADVGDNGKYASPAQATPAHRHMLMKRIVMILTDNRLWRQVSNLPRRRASQKLSRTQGSVLCGLRALPYNPCIPLLTDRPAWAYLPPS